MTDTPDTSPEAIQDALKACAAYHVPTHRLAVLHALSAALDKLRMRTANQSRMLDAAEAERDALKAELKSEKHHKMQIAGDKIDAVSELRYVKAQLAEAVVVVSVLLPLTEHLDDCGPPGEEWQSDALVAALSEARALRARHQKEAGV